MIRIFFDQGNIHDEAKAGICKISNAGLTVCVNYATNVGTAFSIHEGRKYWEVKILKVTQYGFIGIVSGNKNNNPARLLLKLYSSGMYEINYGADVKLEGSAYSANDVVGMALDTEKMTVGVYVNGSVRGFIQLQTGEKELYPAIGNSCSWDPEGIMATANFGAEPFHYPIPAGYTSLDISSYKLYKKEQNVYGAQEIW